MPPTPPKMVREPLERLERLERLQRLDWLDRLHRLDQLDRLRVPPRHDFEQHSITFGALAYVGPSQDEANLQKT